MTLNALTDNHDCELLKQRMIEELKNDALDRPESFGKSLIVICKAIDFFNELKEGVKEYAFQYLSNNQEIFEDEKLKIQPLTSKSYLYSDFKSHPFYNEYEGLKIAIENDKQRMREIEKDMKKSPELPFEATDTIKVSKKLK